MFSIFFSNTNIFILTFIFSIFSYLFQIEETSYSLKDNQGIPLDLKLVELINYENGIFIEVGAYDGIDQSNTKLLEECYGWSGILIEPSPKLFIDLCENRPNSICFDCALGSFEQNNTYVWGDFDGSTMSSVNGSRLNREPQQKVLMRSLQSILDEVGVHHINFFSLDVEGYELNTLMGIDFDKTTFDYLLIEIYIDQFDEVVTLLESNGYELIQNFSNYNFDDNEYWDGTHNDYLFKRRSF